MSYRASEVAKIQRTVDKVTGADGQSEAPLDYFDAIQQDAAAFICSDIFPDPIEGDDNE